jgi:putative phosphoserine phosphatase / 1-acylglycerol-3-phosphate O-acyltransferase
MSVTDIRMISMTNAAIFDLDRTLVLGSSAAVFQRHLADVGLGTEYSIPGMGAYQKSYEMLGENPLMMQVARLFVRSAKGWPVGSVTSAAEAAVDELLGEIPGFAHALLDQHRAEGRKLVLATTSPHAFVHPFAERLGFDHVIATRWLDDGAVYTGELDGEFLWGRAKRDAVRDLAQREGINLAKSYGYSDSAYDVPLLKAVGTPVAVNPDPQLTVIAAINGWQIRHLDVSPGVAKFAGRELQHWLRPLARPELIPNARFDIQGTENIPADGSAIVVFNHRSYFDSTTIAMLIAQAERSARFLGKKEVFDVPFIGKLGEMFGGIRVDRGTGSTKPLEKAVAALEGGELIAMAPEGTIPRGPAFFSPELKGRWGAARLAHATRAPVIPVGLWGTEKVWPRNVRIPNFDLADPPLITIRVGTPVELKYKSLAKDTQRIMTAIAGQLPSEAREHHEPTPEELVLTYPPGYSGDPEAEADRRPGTNT